MTPMKSASVPVNSVADVSEQSSELSPELSIVVPLYCEESNVDYLFERLETVAHDLAVTYEIVCVDDGSKDNTLLQCIILL